MDFAFNTATSLAVGISIACISYFGFTFMQDIPEEQPQNTKQLPIMFKLLLPVSGNVIPFVRSNMFFEKPRKDAQSQILAAGFDQVLDEDRFLAVNIMMVIAGIIAFILSTAGGNPMTGILLFGLFFIYPKAWLKGAVKRRHLEIQKALPNVLDLLTLSVEAGKDFLTSLRDIIARRKQDALGEELERTFHEIQLGKQRRTALKELAIRVQQPDLTMVVSSIVQADELGVSIGHILKIQGDQLRMKRFNRAEKLANEAPVKILFPLALFIMPAVMIILLGPVLLKGLDIFTK